MADENSFSAVDMATAAADGFRDGVAQQPSAQEAVGTGLTYFAACPYDGEYDTFGTAAEACEKAQELLDWNAEQAPDGWPEGTDQICWGVVLGSVVETARRAARGDDAVNDGISEIVEYQLIGTPVAEPTLRLMRAPDEHAMRAGDAEDIAGRAAHRRCRMADPSDGAMRRLPLPEHWRQAFYWWNDVVPEHGAAAWAQIEQRARELAKEARNHD